VFDIDQQMQLVAEPFNDACDLAVVVLSAVGIKLQPAPPPTTLALGFVDAPVRARQGRF